MNPAGKNEIVLPFADGGRCRWRSSDEESFLWLKDLSSILQLPVQAASGESDFEVCQLSWPQGEKPEMDYFWGFGTGTRFDPDSNAYKVYLRRKSRTEKLDTGKVYRQIFHLGMMPHITGTRILAHGVLMEHNGTASLVCGPSGMGKSTFARRLPEGWQAWADDCVLLHFHEGRYYAQPVPTWSLWYAENPPPPRTFDSSRIFELKRVFLLARGSEVAVEKMNSHSALMPEATGSIITFADLMTYGLDETLRRRIMTHCFDFGFKMAQELDFYRLVTPLDREFIGRLAEVCSG